jgi:hypothetical protein
MRPHALHEANVWEDGLYLDRPRDSRAGPAVACRPNAIADRERSTSARAVFAQVSDDLGWRARINALKQTP